MGSKYAPRVIAIIVLLLMRESEATIRPSEVTARVFGGENATFEQYPFYVNYNESRMCAGVMLTSVWVLTTGSCVKRLSDDGIKPPFELKLWHALSREGYHGREYDVAEYHYSFIKKLLSGGVGLFKLKMRVRGTSPINLPQPFEEDNFIGTGVEAKAVGRHQNNSEIVTTVSLNLSVTACARINNMYEMCSTESRIPVFCLYDGGGPIFTGENGTFTLIGIAKAVTSCSPDNSRYYQYFFRVSSVISWILHRIDDEATDLQEIAHVWMGVLNRPLWLESLRAVFS